VHEMIHRNNVPIRYKEEIIWTNSPLLRVFTLLLMGEMRAHSSYNLILKSFYIGFTFESIFPDELELKKVKESIQRMNATFDKDYLISNSLAHRIASILKLITPNIGNRELSKEVAEATSIRPETVKELLIQIERLLNEEYPFRTDEHVYINYLLGRWESRTVVDTLEFGINFNMTDLSPSREVTLQIFRADDKSYSIRVFGTAMDWSTRKSVELKLIDGNASLDKGILTITEFNNARIYKMPIIRVAGALLETYLFKTRIIFENKTI
jgi:hypothetical protein